MIEISDEVESKVKWSDVFPLNSLVITTVLSLSTTVFEVTLMLEARTVPGSWSPNLRSSTFPLNVQVWKRSSFQEEDITCRPQQESKAYPPWQSCCCQMRLRTRRCLNGTHQCLCQGRCCLIGSSEHLGRFRMETREKEEAKITIGWSALL